MGLSTELLLNTLRRQRRIPNRERGVSGRVARCPSFFWGGGQNVRFYLYRSGLWPEHGKYDAVFFTVSNLFTSQPTPPPTPPQARDTFRYHPHPASGLPLAPAAPHLIHDCVFSRARHLIPTNSKSGNPSVRAPPIDRGKELQTISRHLRLRDHFLGYMIIQRSRKADTQRLIAEGKHHKYPASFPLQETKSQFSKTKQTKKKA